MRKREVNDPVVKDTLYQVYPAPKRSSNELEFTENSPSNQKDFHYIKLLMRITDKLVLNDDD